MSPATKTLVSGLFAASCISLVVVGSTTRDRLDLGPSNLASLKTADTSGLVASNSSDVPEGDFFREMVRLLKREYFEEISDDRKLAIGAVRGMITSLRDPRSYFMDPEEFRVFQNSMRGKYEGIGAEIEFDSNFAKKLEPAELQAIQADTAAPMIVALPRVRVVAVVPGGPADRAGVRAGDWVESIDGRWVADPERILRYRSLGQSVSPEALKKVSSEEAQRRQAAYREAGRELRKLGETMIRPLSAKDRLVVGTTGTIKVVWRRGPGRRTTSLTRSTAELGGRTKDPDAVTVRFHTGASERLAKALSGMQSATIDLRNNPQGDFSTVAGTLEVVLPTGTYGEIRTHKTGKNIPLTIKSSSPASTKLTLLVDDSTRGPAEVFALALKAAGRANVVGVPGGDTAWREVVPLSDGSGYTLVTGVYHPKVMPKAAKKTTAKVGGPTRVARVPATSLIAGTHTARRTA